MKKVTLHTGNYIDLKKIINPDHGIHGYEYSYEKRCHGVIITILPYRKGKRGFEFLLRREVTPCWHPTDEMISSITGGLDNPDTNPAWQAMVELEEEAGYNVPESKFRNLGTCHGTKSTDTVYHLFTVDLTDVEKTGEGKGDGSELEAKAECFWTSDISEAVDPLVYVLFYRLEGFSNEDIL